MASRLVQTATAQSALSAQLIPSQRASYSIGAAASDVDLSALRGRLVYLLSDTPAAALRYSAPGAAAPALALTGATRGVPIAADTLEPWLVPASAEHSAVLRVIAGEAGTLVVLSA